MITKNHILFAAAVLMSMSIHAQENRMNDTGGYVGGEIAANSVTTGNSYGNSTYVEKTNGTAFGVYGGYNFTNWFGLESSFTMTNLSKGTDGQSRNATAIGGFSITPKVSFRTSESLSIYVKAGVVVTALCDDHSNNDCWSGTPGTAGFGLQFDLSQHVKLRVGYDVTKGTLTYKSNRSYYQIDGFELTQKRTNVSMHYQF
jgi:opacity protein-like surface antigen